MNQDIRRELISDNLGIKPINHGQVYTFQIAIPDSRKQLISLEERQAIEQSLLAHQSNLISLIIRRTNAYAGEDIEYELVYGADWLHIAQELNIEKVWAWVFDLTDEQTIATIAEMESLSSNSKVTQPVSKTDNGIDSDIAALIDKKLQLATDSVKNSIISLLSGFRSDLDEELKALNCKIDNLDGTELEAILERLDTIQQQLSSSRKIPKTKTVEKQINLLNASEQDIKAALRQVNAQDSHIRAAIEAVQHWKQSEQGLTWQNLEISAGAKASSRHKIRGFAKGTYNQLSAIATIAE